LRRLLTHVHHQVPHGRDQFRRAGLRPEDIPGVADLSRLPLTSKAERQELPLEALIARNHRLLPLIDRSTSGSTGQRMTVRRTWVEERLLNLFRWRALAAYGFRPFDRVGVAQFHARMDPADGQVLMRWAQGLRLLRWHLIDVLGAEQPQAQATAFRPTVLTGMTSAIALLAEKVAPSPRESSAGGWPRFVATGGELLTPPLRAEIARFGVPIHDLYGCNEVNLVAWQCPARAGTYHICDQSLVVEIVDAAGNEVPEGAAGEVVVTSLFSWAMPFVRYRTGDRAVRGPRRCPCGARCSTLLSVQGRTIDTFVLDGGARLHPWEILNAIRLHMGWIRRFQMVQSRRDHVELRVWPLRSPIPEECESLERAARGALRSRASFTLQLRKNGEPDRLPSGKTQLFVPWTPEGAP
jgi:phenylacetate-CoA ligase